MKQVKNDMQNGTNTQLVKPSTPILPLPKKPIEVRNLRTAKRLLSRIITAFQRNEIEDSRAKTLAYLLVSYVSLTRDYEFEERISKLEQMKGIVK